MKNIHRSFQRALALVLAFAMVLTMSSVSQTMDVSAASAKYVKSIKTSKKSVTVNVGKSVKVNATVKVAGKTSQKVTVKTSNKKVATVKAGKPNKKGVSTIKITGKKAGKATITVTTSAKGKKGKKLYAKIKVNVKKADEQQEEPQPQPAPAMTNGSVQLPITNGQSSDPSIATVDATGKVTAGTKAGTVTITGKDANGNTVIYTVTVTQADVDAIANQNKPSQPISVSEESKTISLDAGKGSAIVLNNAEGKEIVYSSANTEIATVDPATGVVVGINPGTTTITASTKDGKESVTITVTVVAIKVTSVSLPEKVEVTVKGTTNLVAEIAPENATDKTLTWTSSDEKIATVSSTGEVYGVAQGTAVITATAASGVYGTCTVTVKTTETFVEGITMEVTNPYVDGNGKTFENTALVGDDLNIRVRVVSNQGPVGNDSVTLTLDDQAPNGYGNMRGYYFAKSESNSSSTTSTTDANGYAKFSISLKDAYKSLKATDGKAQSLKVTAKESGTNKTTSIYVKFVSVNINGITVDKILTNLEPSDNAGSDETGTYWTKSQDNCKDVEFVVSQQVTSDTSDHKVYLDATPTLLLPATPDNIKLGKWEYIVTDGASGPCSVYNDETNKSTTVIVEQVPSGLNYITLYFDKVELSKYTAMNVDVYDKETGTLLADRRKTKTSSDNGTPTVQVEAQDDRESYIVVSLVSQGQVDTDSQGYVLTKLEGNYDSNLVKETYIEPIENAVVWKDITKEALPVYESQTWSYAEALKYLPSGSKYLNANYKYSYDVPSFPRVGNAIIKVKDANDKLLAYFAYPTVNNGKNVNILAPAPSDTSKRCAINIAEDEAKQAVGTIKQEGNQVVIDSRTQGRTFVTAEINVAGLDESELNYQNGGLQYSSVEWAPVPKVEIAETYKDYFAVEGQFVTVLAQLYDMNGNKKTDEGKKIEFSYVDGNNDTITIENKEGAEVGTRVKVAAISNAGSTDANGQVILKLKDETSDDYFSYVDQLSAQATGYNVRLSFIIADGSEVAMASKSNINWVDLGLTFVDSAVAADNPVRTSFFKNAAGEIEKKTIYTVSETKGWQIGYLPIARSTKFQYSRANEVDRFPSTIIVNGETVEYVPSHEFISVSGVNIPYVKGARETTLTQKDNVATVFSTKTTTENSLDSLTGGLSIVDADGKQQTVIFKYYDDNGEIQKAVNIGTGNANIGNTKLKLNIQWNEDGQQVNVFAPETINQNTERRVFIQVLDKYNNPLVGKNVEYQITGVNETRDNEGKIVKLQATEAEQPGLYYFDLAEVAELGDVAECTINIYVEDDSIGDPIKIAYQRDPNEAFAFFTDDASKDYYAVDVVDETTLDIYFNHDIDPTTVHAGEFELVDNQGKALEIVGATTISGDAVVVRLTLKNAIAERTVEHTLTVKEYVDKMTGVSYYLGDTYGQIMNGESYSFKPSER